MIKSNEEAEDELNETIVLTAQRGEIIALRAVVLAYAKEVVDGKTPDIDLPFVNPDGTPAVISDEALTLVVLQAQRTADDFAEQGGLVVVSEAERMVN